MSEMTMAKTGTDGPAGGPIPVRNGGPANVVSIPGQVSPVGAPKRSPFLFPSPNAPMAVARVLENRWKDQHGTLKLRHWRDTWQRWNGSYWEEASDSDMRAWLYQRMEKASYLFTDGRSGIQEVRRWDPARGKIANLTEALAAITNLRAEVEPGWLDGRSGGGIVIPCRNGLLDLETRKLMPPTPLYFNQAAVPFDYDPGAPAPKRWTGFLDSVWPDDQQAVDLLQEVLGYIISGSWHLEKIPYLIGPRRSGKGTVAKVIRMLVGEAHYAGPNLTSLATNFGIAPLIGKSVAVIPDARLPRDGVPQIIENLLTISSGDTITVDRKHRDQWHGIITARIVMMSNDPIAFPDTADALVGRLIPLRMTRSFYGREDVALKTDLPPEIPGIFNWSLIGLDRLMARGRFLEPESSAEAVDLLNRASSPTKAFIADRCVLDPDAIITKDELWIDWQRWCRAGGRDHIGTLETLSRNLFTAAPEVKACKPREYPGGPQVPSYRGIRLAY